MWVDAWVGEAGASVDGRPVAYSAPSGASTSDVKFTPSIGKNAARHTSVLLMYRPCPCACANAGVCTADAHSAASTARWEVVRPWGVGWGYGGRSVVRGRALIPNSARLGVQQLRQRQPSPPLLHRRVRQCPTSPVGHHTVAGVEHGARSLGHCLELLHVQIQPHHAHHRRPQHHPRGHGDRHTTRRGVHVWRQHHGRRGRDRGSVPAAVARVCVCAGGWVGRGSLHAAALAHAHPNSLSPPPTHHHHPTHRTPPCDCRRWQSRMRRLGRRACGGTGTAAAHPHTPGQ